MFGKRLTQPRKILISRGDVLGDVTVSTVVVEPLKKKYPDAEIWYLVRPEYKLLLEPHPHIAGTIDDPLPYTMTKQDYPALFKLAQTIRSHGFDTFIGLWENPRYGLLSYLAGIPRRIGHAWTFWNRLFYTRTVSLNYLDYTLHKAEYNLALLRPLDIHTADSRLSLHASPAAWERLETQHPQLEKGYVMIHLDAGNPQRILPKEHFAELVSYLISKQVPNIILFGRKQNRDDADYIMLKNKHHSALINLTDRLSLEEIAALISRTQLLIGSDSGPAHMASAFGRKAIVYYFNRIQNALHWGPWKTSHFIIKSRHDCKDVCRPTVCRKPDCRLPINFSEWFSAIDYFLSDSDPVNHDDAKPYWFKITANIGIVGSDSESLRRTLAGQGYTAYAVPANLSVKALKTLIARENINMLFIQSNRIPLKYPIAIRWASNYMHFLTKTATFRHPEDIQTYLTTIK